MGETVSITGLKELGETLRQLPREIASKNGGPLKAALFQALKPIRDEARARAPAHDGAPLKKGKQPSGTLKKNIIAKREPRPDKFGLTELYHITVRTGKKRKTGDAFYWKFVEFGHAIVPRRSRGESLRAHRKAVAKYGRVAPRPFLRPAFESRKHEALETFKTALTRGIARAVRKARAGRK